MDGSFAPTYMSQQIKLIIPCFLIRVESFPCASWGRCKILNRPYTGNIRKVKAKVQRVGYTGKKGS